MRLPRFSRSTSKPGMLHTSPERWWKMPAKKSIPRQKPEITMEQRAKAADELWSTLVDVNKRIIAVERGLFGVEEDEVGGSTGADELCVARCHVRLAIEAIGHCHNHVDDIATRERWAAR